jgi:hypothetical protein
MRSRRFRHAPWGEMRPRLSRNPSARLGPRGRAIREVKYDVHVAAFGDTRKRLKIRNVLAALEPAQSRLFHPKGRSQLRLRKTVFLAITNQKPSYFLGHREPQARCAIPRMLSARCRCGGVVGSQRSCHPFDLHPTLS